jgi:hypothetical protein
VHAEDQHAAARQAAHQLARGADSVDAGQAHVEDDDVGLARLGQLVAVARVRGLAHHLEIGLALEERSQPLPEQGMVVHQRNSRFLHVGHRPS